MQRIPIEDRRAIISRKLQGASHQTVAEEVGVSKGTVSNVLVAARAGDFPEFETLDHEIDALINLGKRLEDEDLDVSLAHVGLDVLTWLEDEGLDPEQLRTFRAKLEDLTEDDDAVQVYVRTSIRLHELEEQTGWATDGRLGNLIELLDGRGDLQQLGSIASAASEFGGDLKEIHSAIENAVQIQDHGFDLETARSVASELTEREESDIAAAATWLGERYEEHESLEAAIEELKGERQALVEEIDTLWTKHEDLEADRDQLRKSLDQLEDVQETVKGALQKQEEKWESLESDIEYYQAELDRLQAEYVKVKEALQSIQAERDVVHAYRQFLNEREITETLLKDVADLLEVREGAASKTLESIAPDIRERVETDLTRIAKEMLEGEEFIRMAEHERKLREKGEIEAQLKELRTERDAVLKFREFLDTGEISVDLLEELRRTMQGRTSHTEWWEKRRTEKVRGFLVERLEALTNDREVIDAAQHRSRLRECREEYVDELLEAYGTIDRLTEQLRKLQEALDAELTAQLADELKTALSESDKLYGEENLQNVLQETLADEIDRRVELECEQRVTQAFSAGLERGSRPGVGVNVHLPRDREEG